MASFKLTSPDGTSYKVDAPDEQSAYSAFQKMQGGQAPAGQPDQAGVDAMDEAAPQHEDPGIVSSILNKGLQGLTFGFGDELKAGLKTGGGFLGDYGAQVAKERETNAAIDEHHPIIGALSEIVGSLALPGGAAKAGLSLVGRSAAKAAAKGVAAKAAGRSIGTLEKVGDVARKVGAGAVEGAGYGAISGAGNAEGGLGDRVEGAAEGAPLGAAIGGALPAVTSAVGAVARPFGKAVKARFNPNAVATERVADVVRPAAEARLDRAAVGGQNLAIADVGGAPAQDLLKTAAAQSGERGKIATRANLDSLSAVDRVKRIVSDSFDAPEGAYETAKADIAAARAADPKVGRLYDEFYNTPITPEVFGDPGDKTSMAALLRTPAGRSGLAAAKQNAGNERQPWAKWFETVDNEGNLLDKSVPNGKALDAVRGAVKDAYESAKTRPDGSPFGKALENKKSLAIKTVLDDLTKQMDEVGTGAYGAAREAAGENIRADSAIEFGRKALSTDRRVIAGKMQGGTKGFTPEEQHLARVGLADAIFKKLEGTKATGDALGKFFSTPGERDRLRAFFPTNAEFRTFQQSLINEARKGTTDAIARRASGAARMLNENDLASEAGAAGTARQAVMWGPKAAVLSAVGRALNRVGGMTPKVADEIGRQLMTRDPQEVRRILARVHAIERTGLSKAAKKANVRSLVSAAAANAGGRAVASPEYRGVE